MLNSQFFLVKSVKSFFFRLKCFNPNFQIETHCISIVKAVPSQMFEAKSQQFYTCNPIIIDPPKNHDQHLRCYGSSFPWLQLHEADPLGDTKVVDRSAMDRDFDALGKRPGKSQAFPGNESMTAAW
jgi:hypothetical protein